MSDNVARIACAFITGLTVVGVSCAIAFGAVSCSEIDARTKADCVANGGSAVQRGQYVECIMGGRRDPDQ